MEPRRGPRHGARGLSTLATSALLSFTTPRSDARFLEGADLTHPQEKPQPLEDTAPADPAREAPDSESGLEWEAGLRRLGFASFRPGQRESIETLMQARRLLLVAPTGGGKSLCYQLPASLLPGTTVVVSPLISLMQDQVDALQERGVEATFLASTLSGAELRRRMTALGRGEYQLVYVAPERLAFEGFRDLVRDLACPLVAVDEAHCISEWGHDFRPEYLQIGELIAELPGARTLACTATATPVVRDEILARLGLPAETPQIVHGFARPNLSLRFADVTSRRERDVRVDAALAEALRAPGAQRGAAIIYGPTRKSVESEARRLAGAGWGAEAYHAGLAGGTREAVHRRFSAGETELVVATNAFGMGIDRADVRAVIHLAPPGSLEAWYQEVGRAGRDGEPALGLACVAPRDVPLRRALLEMPVNGVAPSPEVVRHKWSLFLELMRLAEAGSCRHDAVLRYFGDEAETLAGCGRCDVCTGAVMAAEIPVEEAELIVRKALAGVARVHGRFGLQAAAKLLRGAPDERFARNGLDRLSTFGVLSGRNEAWLVQVLRRCVTAGYVDFHGGDRPVVVLTESGNAVMRGERPARLLLPPEKRATPIAAPASRSPHPPRTPRSSDARRPRATSDEALEPAAAELFEALRHHRLEVSRAEGIPPYVIATDRALRDIARQRPDSLAALLLCHGIGEAKAARYGAGLLKVVAGFH